MSEPFDFPDADVPPLLEDKVVIVAGGARGIGRATAVYLGDAGASVVVNDLESVGEVTDLIRDRGGTARAHDGDVTSLEVTEALIAETADSFGRVDGIINFAGVIEDAILHKMTGEQWDRVVHVHLRGHFALLRNAARHWRDRAAEDPLDHQRSFVTVTSRQALGSVGQANYAAAKAGVLGLTWTAAAELSRYNVRVNALMPLAFTRMIESVPEDQRPDDWTRDRMPPGKVAPVAAYLLSDAATDINGCVVRSHGDMIGLVSEPEIERRAYRDGGWTLGSLAERFRSTLGDDRSLDRVEG